MPPFKQSEMRWIMRYYITLLILSLGLVLSGYKNPGRSKDDTWDKTEAKTESVHEDGELTERELRIINRDLEGIEYYGFLLSEYDDPKYIDWNEVFYCGAGLDGVKLTKSLEKAYLNKTGGDEIYTDLTILSADEIEDYVKKTTGLSYSKMRNPLDWTYLRKEDVYVFEHGDTNQIGVDLISGYVEDGIYTVRYMHKGWWGENTDCEYELCFTKNDGYYCFISNTPDKGTKGPADYIFPDSDSRALTESDLSGLDAETLRIGRNEIYARHGRKFKDSALQSYFNDRRWYKPTDISDSKIEQSLNKYEKDNIKLIQSYEQKAPAASSSKTDSSKSSGQDFGKNDKNSGNGSQSSQKGGSDKKRSGSGYTDTELCKMAIDYYDRHYGFRPPIAEITETNGDDVTIHLYEDMGDHTATSAWYVISRKTGKGHDDVFGNKIDLNR